MRISKTLVAVCVMLSACSPLPDAAYQMVGNPAPYARLTLLEGQDVPLEALRGRHAGILFWATWCGHSRARIEQFSELAEQYAGNRSVAFVAVSVDKADQLEKVRMRIQDQKLGHLVHVFSGNDVFDEAFMAFKGESLPFVVTLDPRGIVRSVDVSTSSLEDYLEETFGS